MDYSLNVKRLRMKAVVDSIDGGGAPGTIELRSADRTVLCTLILTIPSFYMVGDDLILQAPSSAFVAIQGQAAIGTITDGAGNLVIDMMTVGIENEATPEHDFEIVLDSINLEVGKQVTIVSASIQHG